MFTAIYFFNLYYLLLILTSSWEAFRLYLLIYYAAVAILVDLHSQKWINTYLFEFTT